MKELTQARESIAFTSSGEQNPVDPDNISSRKRSCEKQLKNGCS